MCKCAVTIYKAQFYSASLNCSEPKKNGYNDTRDYPASHILTGLLSQRVTAALEPSSAGNICFPPSSCWKSVVMTACFLFPVQWGCWASGSSEGASPQGSERLVTTVRLFVDPKLQMLTRNPEFRKTSQKKWSCRNSWPEKDSRSGILECFHFIPSWEIL